MIEVSRHDGGIRLRGHAHYAEAGKDIVCAGVSTLAQVLVHSIETLTQNTIQYDISPGTVDINYGNLSELAQVLVDSFFLGIGMIAEEYPNHVSLV